MCNIAKYFKFSTRDTWAVLEVGTKYIPTKNGYKMYINQEGQILYVSGSSPHIWFGSFIEAEQFIKDVRTGKKGKKKLTIIP